MDLLRVLLGAILLSLLFVRPVAGWNTHPDLTATFAVRGGA